MNNENPTNQQDQNNDQELVSPKDTNPTPEPQEVLSRTDVMKMIQDVCGEFFDKIQFVATNDETKKDEKEKPSMELK